MSGILPLLIESSETETIAFYNGQTIQRNTFLSHVEQIRIQLPRHKYCINLCEDRYHFLVVFAACVSLEQISLLPNSRAENEIERLQRSYKDHYFIDESNISEICQNDVNAHPKYENNYDIDAEQIVSVLFTSGSTGIPKANPKTWKQLFESAKRVKERFCLNNVMQHSLIATVPPQHMFGFETTIVYPLIAGVAIHSGRPFYPLDIQKALSDMPSPHILITTPFHLSACNSQVTGWPDIDLVISSTAPMPDDVAKEAEKLLKTRVYEIYGCSEAGVIATRQMTRSTGWQLLKNYKITTINETTTLDAPGFKERINIPDNLQVYDDFYFRLVGRNSDLINIGGKRGSISDLTNKLKAIEGVNDAVFIMPDETKGKRIRLAAFAVVSNTNEKKLRRELAKFIDPVFLPRSIIILKQLPYNDLGKLPREILLELLNQHKNKIDDRDKAKVYTFNFMISNTHPCLEGHFMGNPVVPGVVIIDEIIRGLRIQEPNIKIINIPVVKFIQPLKSEVIVEVAITEKKSSLYKFTCYINEVLIVNGQLRTQKVAKA